MKQNLDSPLTADHFLQNMISTANILHANKEGYLVSVIYLFLILIKNGLLIVLLLEQFYISLRTL